MSYSDILEAVSKDEVFAAVINLRVASYLSKEKMRDLVALYHIDRPYPVAGVIRVSPESYYGNKRAMNDNFTCMRNFRQDIFNNAELQYLRPLKVSHVISTNLITYQNDLTYFRQTSP